MRIERHPLFPTARATQRPTNVVEAILPADSVDRQAQLQRVEHGSMTTMLAANRYTDLGAYVVSKFAKVDSAHADGMEQSWKIGQGISCRDLASVS